MKPKPSSKKQTRDARQPTHLKKKTRRPTQLEALRLKLDEAEETLEAIRSGGVDALVISGPEGEQVFTLKDAARPYQVLVEEMNEGVLTLSADGYILYANARFAEMLHLPLGHVLGEALARFVSDTDAASLRQLLDAARAGRCRDELTLHTGRVSVPVQLSLRAVVLDGVPRLSAIVTDLTERRQIEDRISQLNVELAQRVQARTAELETANADLRRTGEQLQQSERTANDLIRYAPTAIFEIDFRGPRFKTVNDAMCAMSGYSRQELLATSLFEFLDDDSVVRSKKRVQKMLAGEPVDPFVEYRVRVKDGSFRDWVLDTTVTDKAGQPVGEFIIAHDVTERKRAEQATINSEARFKALYQNLPFMTLTFQRRGADLVLLDYNQVAVAMSHEGIGRLVGKTAREIYDARPDIAEYLERAFNEQTVLRYAAPYRMITTGEDKYTNSTFAFVPPDIVMLHVEDITQRKQAEEDLRESEERYRSLADNVPCILMRFDRDLRVVYLNARADEYNAVPRREIIGKTNRQIGMPPRLCDLWERATREVFDTGEPRNMEFGYESVQGPRTFDLRFAPEFGADGTVEYVLGVSTDVTERKRTEEALMESDQRFRVAVRNASLVLAQYDRDLRYVWIYNPHSDYDPSSVMGKRDDELEDSEGARRLVAIKQRVIDSGSGAHEEISFLRSDGIKVYDLIVEPIIDSNGRVAGGTTSALDITERKRAEDERETARTETENEKRRLEAAMDAVPMGLAILDAQGGNLQSNRAFEQVWGEGRPKVESFSGYSTYRAWWADTGQPVTDEEWASVQALRQGVTVVGQLFEIQRFDGSHAFVLNSAAPIRDSRGHIIGSAVAIQDITELRRAEDSLREALHHIQSIKQDLEDRANELEVANEELERLANSLAVDLRSPLVSLRGVSRVLAQDYGSQLPPQAQSLFQLIQANAEEMEGLTQGLVQLMRVTRRTIRPQNLDPEESVRAAWDNLQSERGDRTVELTIDPLPNCRADPLALKQVWVNLLSNALKATRHNQNAHIQVGGYLRGNRIFYFVKDNGIGFDMSYVGTIFRAFQRYHHADEWQGGAGVGLAIVESIIRRHGGRVWAEGAVNQGATFYFEI